MKPVGRGMQNGQRLALALALFAAVSPVRSEVSALRMSQAVQLEGHDTKVRAYLGIENEDATEEATVDVTQLSGTLGANYLDVERVLPFMNSEEGVAYVFLVDISSSLSQREFDLLRNALNAWMGSLRPQDRSALIAFGDRSQIVVDFTAESSKIGAGLQVLGPTDNSTVLHDAIRDALQLCTRRDPDLPGRRVLMVLTDGRDEGSGITEEDILEMLRETPVPIYAIGFSRIRDLEERRHYLDLLHRFASLSGGDFFEGTTASLGAAYEAIRQSIHGVWTADLRCSQCVADGGEYRLQVSLRENDRVFSDGLNLRLLPGVQASKMQGEGTQSQPIETRLPDLDAPDTSETEATPSISEPETAVEELEATPPAETRAPNREWNWFLWLLVAAALVAAYLIFRRTRSAAVGHGDDTEQTESDSAEFNSGTVPLPVKPKSYATEQGVPTTRPPRPAIMRLVRMTVVRGEQPGPAVHVDSLPERGRRRGLHLRFHAA